MLNNTLKYKSIPIVMWISQLLLTGFVIYWLFGQFRDEKQSLQKELQFEFMEAQNQAMDSSLHVLLQPLLNDSTMNLDTTEHIGWTSSLTLIDSTHAQSKYITDHQESNKTIQFDVIGPEKAELRASNSIEFGTLPHQAAVLRGVKMIIKMSDDSLRLDGENTFSSLQIDSSLLLGLASERLNKISNTGFEVLWYADTTPPRQAEKTDKRIRFHSALSEPLMIYEVINYEVFLFKEMIPQILFGLLLLLLTGFAFIFTYRSLKKQLLLNTLRNEFISNVSHELKTPVSTVKVALESLRNYDLKKDSAVSDEYLKMAAMEMDRLDLLIQKILTQSLLESQQILVEKRENDLIQVCENLLNTFKPRIDEQEGSLIFYTDIEHALVEFDELYVMGVLGNLVDNAIKYGGSPPEIKVVLSEERKAFTISVSDNGDGIPEEYHNKVFERFFRVPAGDKHNVKGYGLGLSFASEVMNQHQGSIKIENNQNGGCTFTVSFPK